MRDFSLSGFLDPALVGAIMRVSLFMSAAGAASLAARFVRARADKRPPGEEASGQASGAQAAYPGASLNASAAASGETSAAASGEARVAASGEARVAAYRGTGDEAPDAARDEAWGEAGGEAPQPAPPGPPSGPWPWILSWLAVLSPTAPVFAFVILFEIEATQAFLAADCGPGEDCLTRVLVWPAFLFVGLGVLAACVSVCRRLRLRLGGAALWPYGAAPLAAGALAALL